MEKIIMTAIDASQVMGRKVVDTGVSMIGMGGNVYHCGHCGRKMMHAVDLSQATVPLVYLCGSCGTYNEDPGDGK